MITAILARYCAGGYIFQITDHEFGPLLSGPTYPDAFNTFDGQGIPDAFNLSPLRAVGEATEALIIGVGICELRADYTQNTVKSFSQWTCTPKDNFIQMTTMQVFHEWALELERFIWLNNRTVKSQIKVRNTGRAPIPVRWFPHPFFPHAGDALCKLNIPVTVLPQSDGYVRRADGYVHRKNWPWDQRGHYLPLFYKATKRLVILQRHPKLGMVSATCHYAPSFFPIWGNVNTFSWEPFYERTIAPDSSPEVWGVDYDF